MGKIILSNDENKQSYFKGNKKSNKRRGKSNVRIIEQLAAVRTNEKSSSIETRKNYQLVPTKIDVNVDDLEERYPKDINLSEYEITRDELIDSIRKRREYQIIKNEVWDIMMDLTIGVPTTKGFKYLSWIEYKERIDYLKYQSYYSDMYYKACEPFDHIIYPFELCETCNMPYCNTCKKGEDTEDGDVYDQEYFSEDSSDDEYYDDLGW